jgi:hypothetical protein
MLTAPAELAGTEPLPVITMTEGQDPSLTYRDRAARFLRDRDEQADKSRVVSYMRLGTFLGGAGCLIAAYTFFRTGAVSSALTWIGAGALVTFAVLVVRQASIERRRIWFNALWQVNDRGGKRLARQWSGLPAATLAAPPPGHPDADDLDLFGRASLFQITWTAGTERGRETLRRWLLAPADAADARARQAAVAELAPLVELREALAAESLAGDVSAHDVEGFLAWAEETPWLSRRTWLVRAVRLSSGATLLLIALQATGVVADALWLLPLLVNVLLSAITGRRVHHTFDRAFSHPDVFQHYAELLEVIARTRFTSPLLARLQQDMKVGDVPADREFRQLHRLMELSDLRHSALVHAPVHLVTLWDLHVLLFVERWQESAGRHVRQWVDALGEIEALAALGGLLHDHPGWTLPDITAPGAPVFEATALGHPLLAPSIRVDNDVHIGPPGTFLLVTGSNMSGKSTLLRAVGLNVVLAQAGGPVCATFMRLPPVRLWTSMRVQDSLEEGVSYFMAALKRLKDIVDAARPAGGRHDPPLLYLLDELLGGTNTAERQIAVRRIVRHLLGSAAIGAVTTHDLALAEAEELSDRAVPVHFTETISGQGADETLSFDYRLRPGVATSRNALKLMKMIGLGDE